jgi:hypothetical protein
MPEGEDGCPTFAKAYSGFPVDIASVDELHAAFLNESRTRDVGGAPCRKSGYVGRKRRGEAPTIALISEGRVKPCGESTNTPEVQRPPAPAQARSLLGDQ